MGETFHKMFAVDRVSMVKENVFSTDAFKEEVTMSVFVYLYRNYHAFFLIPTIGFSPLSLRSRSFSFLFTT